MVISLFKRPIGCSLLCLLIRHMNRTTPTSGGAIGLTDNPSALRRWMIAGPEVAWIIEEFHNEQNHHGAMGVK